MLVGICGYFMLSGVTYFFFLYFVFQPHLGKVLFVPGVLLGSFAVFPHAVILLYVVLAAQCSRYTNSCK